MSGVSKLQGNSSFQESPRLQNMASRVARKVEAALRGDDTMKGERLELVGRIAGAAAAATVELAADRVYLLQASQKDWFLVLLEMLKSLESRHAEPSADRLDIVPPLAVEEGGGTGLGRILGAEEGHRALSAYAVSRPIEEWAGPVAGATLLAERYHIPRSTLNHWLQGGAVIGLLKGTRRYVYPLDQFVDARPARGIGEVGAIIGNPRLSWLWLSRENPVLGGKRPIELLKQDRVKEVVEAAKSQFE